MTLSAAFNTAQNMLGNHGTSQQVLAQNLSNASNSDYARRTALTVNTEFGGAVVIVQRAQDNALLTKALYAISQDAAQQKVTDGLDTLSSVFGGNDQPFAPSTYLTNLYKSLQTYASKPSDDTVAASVVANAQNLARSLNDASTAVQGVRAQADLEIKNTVADLNDLLSQFKVANDRVMNETASGGDPYNAMDVREGVLKKISEIVGVNVLRREPNDMVLYTSEGTTLFETSARTVTFTPNYNFDATTTGSAIKIDGVPLQPGSGGDTTAKGKLAGLLQVRDQIAPVVQKQLDEMARGLITAFSESDSGVPPTVKPGLFTWPTGTIPAAGTAVPNLAALIKVNPLVDPAAGGIPSRIRDGSINGAAFNKNTTNASGFTTVINGYMTALDTPRPFDPTAQLNPNTSVVSFTAKAIGWLEDIRQSADTAKENKAAAKTVSVEAYSNTTGANLDDQTAIMMDLENAYKTTNKILSTIDEMFKSLLDAV